MDHTIKQILLDLNLSEPTSFVPFFPKVRDRDDISVLKCEQSGVLLLSRCDHMDMSHYQNKESFNYWRVDDLKQARTVKREDHQRRFADLNYLFSNKKWLDVGTGEGGALKVFSEVTKSSTGIELQQQVREALVAEGLDVKNSIQDIKDEDFDIISLFHVFEHFTNPIEELKEVSQKLKPGGKIVIEVPHAKDFMIDFLDLEAFKSFTFWSEHLILHTRQTLEAFMKAAGFKNIMISSVQRYALANHLHWLAKGERGGQEKWGVLRSPDLDQAYANKLSSLDMTDTLVAVGERA